MKILITGGSGFVGTSLSRKLLDKGHQVTAVGSRSQVEGFTHPGFSYLQADTTKTGEWQNHAKNADAVFNLTGKSIFGRWNRAYKKALYDSRIMTTRHLVDALNGGSTGVLINASAVGIYGDRGEEALTESSTAGTDFLASLSVDWEKEALAAESGGTRVAIARFGIVLGAGGGAMSRMMPAFKKYMGGPLGNGSQWFSWIHLDDLVSGLIFLMKHEDAKGPFNFSAPNPMRNKDFVKALGRALGRPAAVPAPAFMLKMILGEFAGTLLASQRMMPERLSEAGFTFKYPDIDSALVDIIGTSKK